MLTQYLPIVVFLAVALGFGVLLLFVARALGPKRHTPEKAIPYECGRDPAGNRGGVAVAKRAALPENDDERPVIADWSTPTTSLSGYVDDPTITDSDYNALTMSSTRSLASPNSIWLLSR